MMLLCFFYNYETSTAKILMTKKNYKNYVVAKNRIRNE
jgi:hypothetical protein